MSNRRGSQGFCHFMQTQVIVLFVLLLIFIAIVLMATYISKTFISKKNIFYFLPLLALSTALYSVGYAYGKGFYDFFAFFECLVAGVRGFGFDLKREYVELLFSKNVIYAISMYAVVVLSSLTTISTSIGFVKAFLIKLWRVFSRVFRKPAVLLLGLNEEAFTFAKKEKRSIILIDRKEKLDPSWKQTLYENKVAYTRIDYSAQALSRLIAWTKGKTYIFQFESGLDRVNFLTKLIGELEVKEGNEVDIHVMVNDGDSVFVNKALTECKHAASISASSFSMHEIMGRKFSAKHNLAEFLPSSFIEKATLKENKDIDVVVLGAGKGANAIVEELILNNQFVTINDGKYCLKPVTYHLFDINDKAFDTKLVNMFSEGAKPFELPAIIKKARCNLKAGVDLSLLSSDTGRVPMPGDNRFVYYFVNIGDSLSNIAIANSIAEQLDHQNAVIFYAVDSIKEALPLNASVKVIPFGFKEDLLSLDNIADEDSRKMAEALHALYSKSKSKNQPFQVINIVEKYSNLRAWVNAEFKLNLLRLSLKENGSPISKKDYKAMYFEGSEEKVPYEDYFKLSTRNALRYQEHARWLTYYYWNDFKRMEIKDIVLKDNELIHKDLAKRRHAFVAPFYELDDIHKAEAKLYFEAELKPSFEESLEYVETYKYDSEILDSIYKEKPLYKLDE